MEERIQVPINVKYDVKYEKKEGAQRAQVYYVIEHNMCIVWPCESSGEHKAYSSPAYYGARLKDGFIEFLDNKTGWHIDQEATKLYADKKAEQELLT